MSTTTKAAAWRLAEQAGGLAYHARATLRDALLACTKALRMRPEPRWTWDDLARPIDEKRLAKLFGDVPMCRSALSAAQKEGPTAFAATRAMVRAYLRAHEAEVFRGFDAPKPTCAMQGAAVIAKELGEATTAAVEFAACPGPASQHRAVIECEEALDVIDGFSRGVLAGQFVRSA